MEDVKEGAAGGAAAERQMLHDRWTFSYSGPVKANGTAGNAVAAPSGAAGASNAWNSTFREIYSVEAVDELWGVLNNIATPSQLEIGSDYHVFREGIKPEWEDSQNVSGGKWVISFNTSNPNAAASNKEGGALSMDDAWLFTILALVGENFAVNGDDVCGAVISVRPSRTRIALWLRTTDPVICQAIGAIWKEQIHATNTKIAYQAHHDSIRVNDSYTGYRANVKYEV
jgi:translation initiation factor 4E